MVTKNAMTYTGKSLVGAMDKSKLNFENPVQRSFVWDKDRMSKFVYSLIERFIVPPMLFVKREDGNYDVIDGKQRCTTIASFMRDEFMLSDNFPICYDEDGNEFNFSEMHFSELPEWAQDNIRDFVFNIYWVSDVEEKVVRTIFALINNGKPLTAVELTRVNAKALDRFQQIAAHDMITIAITDKGKARYNDENVAMQIWAMCFCKDPDFSTKAFRPLIENADVTDEQFNTILSALDYVLEFYNALDPESKEAKRVIRKSKSRSHLVSLTYLAKLSIESEIDSVEFCKMAYDFFNSGSDTSVSPEYNSTVGAGTGRADTVQKRMKVLDSLVKKHSKGSALPSAS